MLEESGTSRAPLTSSAAVDWQMSPDLFELNFPMGLNKLNNSFDSKWICYCKQDLIKRHHIMSLCSKEAKNGISSECLSVVSEKDEHGTVTKDDWMHIVNKHPSLSRLPLSLSIKMFHTTFHLFLLLRSCITKMKWQGLLWVWPRVAK